MDLLQSGIPDIEPNTLSLKEAAKFYAGLGMHVFPLQPNKKVPLKNWSWKRACTRDIDTIEAWWTQYPTANIGLLTGQVNNVMVMDVDMKTGQNGIGSYQALAQEAYEGPLQVTPSGGRHLLFKYRPGLKNFVKKGDFGGLDMRSDNGYIVAAPSITPEGLYRWSQLGNVPEMPGNVWGACERWSEGIGATELDLPDCVETLPKLSTLGLKEKHLEYLQNGDTEPWGGDESAAIYGVASAIMHRVHDVAIVYSIMLDNPFSYACAERHTVGAPERWMWIYGIGKALESHGQFEAGLDASDFFTPTAAAVADTQTSVAVEPQTIPFFRNICDFELLPPVWIIDGLMEVGQVGVLYGDPSVGKTFTLLDIGLHIVCDKKWHNQKLYKSGSVLYVTTEGNQALRRRVEAWWQHYNALHKDDPGFEPVSPEVITNGGFYVSTKGIDVLELETMGPLRDMVNAMPTPPVLIIIDTLASNMAGEENSSKDISILTTRCKAMANAWGTTVLLAHHSGVQDKDRMRGSSAIRGNVDFVIKQEAVEKSLNRTVELDVQKNKDGDMSKPLYFEMRVQHLINVLDQNGAPSTSLALKQIAKAHSLVDASEQTRFSVQQADVLNTAMECIEEKRGIGDTKQPYASFEELWASHDQFLRDNRKSGSKDAFQKTLLLLVRTGKMDMNEDQGTVWYSLVKPKKEKTHGGEGKEAD